MTDLLDKARALEEQLRADDKAMARAPWRASGRTVSRAPGDGPGAVASDVRLATDSAGIARTRNALPAIADTLRDLCAEVEQMRTQRDEAVADGVLSQRVCDIENDRAQLTTERDTALARLRELETGIDRVSTVLAEQGWPGLAEQMRRLAGEPSPPDASLATRVKELEADIARKDRLYASLVNGEDRKLLVAERDRLSAEVAAMRPVVEAACDWFDYGPVGAGIAPAVAGCRARKP